MGLAYTHFRKGNSGRHMWLRILLATLVVWIALFFVWLTLYLFSRGIYLDRTGHSSHISVLVHLDRRGA